MGELLALKWEDIDFSTAQLHVRRTINRLAKYEAHDGENKTEIVFGTPKTKNSRRTIPLTRTMADELTRWKQQQAQDKLRAGDKYTDYGFIVTNEFGHYFEQKTFKDYYDRLLKDADIGHFTFHALRHTFATRALVPDFPKITTQTATLDAALLEVKQQIEKALRQYKNPPIPTKQEQIVVPNNSVLVLVKAS